MSTQALTLASLFFLLSLSPKKSAVIFAAIPIVASYTIPLQARYIGKCTWESIRFLSLLVQGRYQHWNDEQWVKETTLRLDHEHIATLEHSMRSETMMEGFGRFLNWTDQEVNDGKLAAGIHDVGKLFMPSSILEKPGQLDAEEMVIMRRHVVWSRRTLWWIPRFTRLTSIVGDHHEAYDGSGYPNKLVRNEISKVTHALAIVDAYDAMRSARYYKQSKSKDWAFWELRRCAGAQFDPELVEAFIAFLGNGGHSSSEPDPYEEPPHPGFKQPIGSKQIMMSA